MNSTSAAFSHCTYIGRFAPSPSGELHFGSLVTALGSYLQAKHQQGQWRVRIEDIDPPREVFGAASRILSTLEHFGLYWDDEVVYQSTRHIAYREILAQLHQQQRSYFCSCSRQRISQLGGYYDGYCRYRQLSPGNTAIRFRQHSPVYHFHDLLQGQLTADMALAEEDFIIHRKDGLFAYNLAVVVDDHHQGITEIVRGADLIQPTVRQIALYNVLNYPVPNYIHLPLVLKPNGQKLSKQNHAKPILSGDPRYHLVSALRFLQQVTLDNWQDMSIENLLQFAVTNWDLQRVPKRSRILTNYE